MTKMKKKGTRGMVVSYLSQKQAMRRLQLSLPNFRRVCILKGIYPVEPGNRKKVGKGNNQPRIYYHTKDIGFLAHEPLIKKFRQLRIFQKKLKKAREKKDIDKVFRIRMNKPRYTLHHLVKERYPTRRDAINDMSDSLNLIFLFSRLPRLIQFNPFLIGLCRRLSVEFLNLVIATQAVRKAFISIKGFYIQSELDGIPVIWVIPHTSVTHAPTDVDYRILATCVEFDATMVGSLLCHLYRLNGLSYPPKLSFRVDPDPTSYYCGKNENYFELLSCLSYPLKRTQDSGKGNQLEELTELQAIDDQVSHAVTRHLEVQKILNLFKGKRVFLMREVPREVICLIIRSCGGDCSWDKTVGSGWSFDEEDPTIDYQIVDRPMKDMKVTRYYVQPQWIFDSLNAARLLPAQDYLPGASLPPHLSPFTTGSGLNDFLDTAATVSQRGGLTGVAAGYGEGADLYRPPEADYLAGLVTLTQLRGTRLKAQVEVNTIEHAEQVIHNPRQSDGSSDDDALDAERSASQMKDTMKLKKNKSKIRKAATGEKPTVTPGRVESKLSQEMQQRAEANTERKLREMLLPKKQRNAYAKMVHSIGRKKKEVNKLTEKRRAFDSKKK